MRRDMTWSRRAGEGRWLRSEAGRADTESVSTGEAASAGRGHDARTSERGQAMVEFAIIAPVFVLLVAGIIQFGVALNYWLDMQRIANQGARWAVVNAYPGCGLDVTGPCPPNGSQQSLAQYLASESISGGLNPCVEITIPSGGTVGNPVTVRLATTFDFVPIVGIGRLNLGADATMRIEQPPTKIVAEDTCP